MLLNKQFKYFSSENIRHQLSSQQVDITYIPNKNPQKNTKAKLSDYVHMV